MERNYESEKKKRELVYLLDFKDMPKNSSSIVKRCWWGPDNTVSRLPQMSNRVDVS